MSHATTQSPAGAGTSNPPNAATEYKWAQILQANTYDSDNNDSNGQQVKTDDTTGSTTITVYLQHGEKVTISGIPYGASYTVTELPGNYKPSLVIDGDDEATNSGGSVTDNSLTEDTILTFTNTRDGMIPTEIRTRPLIAGIILLAIALPVLFGAGVPRGRVALEKVPVEAHRGRSRKRQSRR